MPALGRDLDARSSSTSVSIRRVSPWNTGLGKRTSSQPRLATAVPRVVSPTEMPTMRPRVKPLLTMRWPNSVSVRQYSSSRCSRAGLWVMHAEPDVVGLGDGAPDGMLEGLPDVQLVEVKSWHARPPPVGASGVSGLAGMGQGAGSCARGCATQKSWCAAPDTGDAAGPARCWVKVCDCPLPSARPPPGGRGSLSSLVLGVRSAAEALRRGVLV